MTSATALGWDRNGEWLVAIRTVLDPARAVLKRQGGYRPWWTGLHVAVYGWRNAQATAKLNGKPVAASFASDPGVLNVDLPDQPGPAVLILE